MYCVLCEVGTSHEVGGWHAFFACELYLVEVDVAVLYCYFQYFFAVANECACGVCWCAEFCADFVDFHICGIAFGVSEFDPCSWIRSKTSNEVAYGFGCGVEIDSASVFEDFWRRFKLRVES